MDISSILDTEAGESQVVVWRPRDVAQRSWAHSLVPLNKNKQKVTRMHVFLGWGDSSISPCLASTRSWVQSPIPKKRKKHGFF